MNTWPQAVWIVNSLQKNFDFTNDLKSYINDLKNINIQVNELTRDVYQKLLQQKMSFIATKNEDNNPSGITRYDKDSVWFIEE